MASEIIDPLNAALRALREIQAPEHVLEASDRPGGYRVSSAAFKPGRDGSVSADLEESMLNAGLDVRFRYPALPRAVGLVAQPVREFTARGMSVTHVPLATNDHHGEVRMDTLTRSQIQAAARNLADSCEILDAIDGAEVRRQLDLRKSVTGQV